jgi:hypothetical protein
MRNSLKKFSPFQRVGAEDVALPITAAVNASTKVQFGPATHLALSRCRIVQTLVAAAADSDFMLASIEKNGTRVPVRVRAKTTSGQLSYVDFDGTTTALNDTHTVRLKGICEATTTSAAGRTPANMVDDMKTALDAVLPSGYSCTVRETGQAMPSGVPQNLLEISGPDNKPFDVEVETSGSVVLRAEQYVWMGSAARIDAGTVDVSLDPSAGYVEFDGDESDKLAVVIDSENPASGSDPAVLVASLAVHAPRTQLNVIRNEKHIDQMMGPLQPIMPLVNG